MKSRRILEQRFNKLYTKLHDDKQCYYCGDIATSIDHIPALTLIYAYGIDYFESKGIALVTVSACHDCNTRLNAKPAYTVQHRARIIYDRLIRVHQKLLAMPTWDKNDLDNLSGSLCIMVENWVLAKTHIERRLSYLEETFSI